MVTLLPGSPHSMVSSAGGRSFQRRRRLSFTGRAAQRRMESLVRPGHMQKRVHARPLAEIAAYYAAHPDSEGHPVSGDECARARYSQCGDPDPDPTTGCRGEKHCQAAPHEGGAGWIYGRTARYRDIAHVLYPGGTAPVPVEDAPAPHPEAPVQLALFELLTTA